MTNPLNTPPIPPSRSSPTPKAPEEEEVGGQAKPFSMPKEAGKATPTAQPQQTPYELAREGSVPKWTESQMAEKMGGLNDKLASATDIYKDPNVEKGLTDDHKEALNLLIGKMDPDMKEIAKRTGADFKEVKKTKEEGVVNYVVRWLNGSQTTMSSAIAGFSEVKKMDPAAYFKLQAAVQRATERAELFASIVGSSVSGIKTLMSMQLG